MRDCTARALLAVVAVLCMGAGMTGTAEAHDGAASNDATQVDATAIARACVSSPGYFGSSAG